ncbi:N-acetylneuraminate synthase family protein [Flavobacterium flavigenum]|uniref:N-acetylneuraminate synthase family protein n=1 Tax=Flavobacterium flavigenum TaxID=3003258 RepID=UPI0024823CE3|nr:N-acetylneuraminate synthase family protein [Flavobacterium flavigenum]
MENYLNQIKNIVSELQTNKIYILGKGPTSGKIKTSILGDGIVININDSERIFPGHFCLVHSLWAHESIKANGSKAKCYFSSRITSPSTNWYQLPYEPETFETSEKTLSIIENDQLSITDFLFISATKLALAIQETLSIKMEVYFIGFDFYSNVPNVITDFSDHQPEYTDMVLKTQESIFKTLKKYFSGSKEISFIHVGNRTFSDISVETFNKVDINLTKPNSLKQNNELYKVLLENTSKGIPIIVAELTNNHIGDENRLRAMVRLAKGAGANVIKVQKRDVDTFYTETELNSPYDSPFGNTLRDYRKGVELNDRLFDVLIEECASNEIFWFLSILDVNSFEYVKKYDLPLLKLPSTISKHKNFLLNVGNNFKGDLVISTGFTDVEYEKFVLQNFTQNRRLFLLQCTSSYPAPPESCQVSVIRHYNNLKVKEYPNIIPGYSSHDIGSMASMMALSAGALMIEKHVKLGDLDWIHFDGVALDLSTNQFRNFVHDMKIAQSICGKQEKEIHVVEHHKYEPNEKSN